MWTLAVIAVIAAVVYGVSLKYSPLRACWHCKGSKRHHSSLFRGARGRCWFCKGTGEKPRFGVRLFMRKTYRAIKAGQHGRNF
jgi:hypothetical protein